MNINDYIDTEQTIAKELLLSVEYPWEALSLIEEYIARLRNTLRRNGYLEARRGIFIAEDADVAAGAYIEGPTVIGHGSEVRHGAYIRGSAIIGDGVVIGNSSEIKGSIIANGAQISHYNYVGDSILGYKAHLGAGAILSNLKSDKTPVCTVINGEKLNTGRRKLGALVGDGAEIGCSSVLCPGATVGRGATVYPLVRVRGEVPHGSICKGEGMIAEREER